MVKRIFARRFGAAAISQPQPRAYDLKRCHYAAFCVRFNGVSHGWVSRDTLRLADFLWMMPVRAARMSVGSAATRAVFAAALLPLAIASSTPRSDVRMRERRALFTSVRRAILRVAFLADLVLAIDPSLGFASVIANGAALSPAQKSGGGRVAPGNAAPITGSGT